MFRNLVIIGVLITSTLAATTQPDAISKAKSDLATAQQDHDSAMQAESAAQAELTSEISRVNEAFMTAADTKALSEKILAAKEAHEVAKDLQTKMDAGSKWNTLSADLERKRLAFIAASPSLKNLQSKIDACRGQTERSSQELVQAKAAVDRAVQAAEASDPLQIAISNHTLLVGMSVEDASKAIGTRDEPQTAKIVQQDAVETVYQWDVAYHINAQDMRSKPYCQATFRSGKLVSFTKF